MSYAIICDARKGESLGIDTLAMVDRSKCQREFWTTDESHLVMRFFSKKVAAKVCARLQHNDPRVVEFSVALGVIQRQKNSIDEAKADNAMGFDHLLSRG